jgi:hypothetical protein
MNITNIVEVVLCPSYGLEVLDILSEWLAVHLDGLMGYFSKIYLTQVT